MGMAFKYVFSTSMRPSFISSGCDYALCRLSLPYLKLRHYPPDSEFDSTRATYSAATKVASRSNLPATSQIWRVHGKWWSELARSVRGSLADHKRLWQPGHMQGCQ